MAEVKVWTVAIGNAPMPWASRKTKQRAKEALDYVNSLEGFIGVYTLAPKGSLCLFRTENDAKIAKNLMDAKGIRTGINICEVFIDEMYVR